jgi:hypothetical protein
VLKAWAIDLGIAAMVAILVLVLSHDVAFAAKMAAGTLVGLLAADAVRSLWARRGRGEG